MTGMFNKVTKLSPLAHALPKKTRKKIDENLPVNKIKKEVNRSKAGKVLTAPMGSAKDVLGG